MKEDYVHINRPQNATLKTAQSEEITFVLFLEIAAFQKHASSGAANQAMQMNVHLQSQALII